MSRLIFSYLSVVQILSKAKEKFFTLMEGFFIYYQICTLVEVLVRGSCPYSAQTENHWKFIVENAMFQPVLDNMALTNDGVKWMRLPHFRGDICWAWKRNRSLPRRVCRRYVSCPDGIWPHNQPSPTPPVLHRCRRFSTEPVWRTGVGLLLKSCDSRRDHAGRPHPAWSPALVQGASPVLWPWGCSGGVGWCQQEWQQQHLVLACLCRRLLFRCPWTVSAMRSLKKRKKLISESDTSRTFEALLGPRFLHCTEDRELALPCPRLLRTRGGQDLPRPRCQALHRDISRRVPMAEDHSCRTTAGVPTSHSPGEAG